MCRRVDGHELHALDLGLDHAVYGVHPGAADADDAQDGMGRAHRRDADERLRLRHGLALGRDGVALEDVLRDVVREDGLQALLGARHALVAAPALLALGAPRLALVGATRGLGHAPAEVTALLRGGLLTLGVRLRLRHVARDLRRWAALGQGPAELRLGRGRPLFLARLLLGRSLVLLRLAEELRQGTLAHARPLTACHSPGPPPLADGRRPPPYRPGRT